MACKRHIGGNLFTAQDCKATAATLQNPGSYFRKRQTTWAKSRGEQ